MGFIDGASGHATMTLIGPLSKLEVGKVLVSVLVIRALSVLTRLKNIEHIFIVGWWSHQPPVNGISGYLDLRSARRKI